jgi:23S rRNA (adenine1618-N6)-methyltransferase
MQRRQEGPYQVNLSFMHVRNKHSGRYDLLKLKAIVPELSLFVFTNQYGDETIDFSNPEAVKLLNQAILKFDYGLSYWDIPKEFLCPPIPGRADYVHHLADLLATSFAGVIPKGANILGLDVGVGANCIYPIIGEHEYGWSFIGSEIDIEAICSARLIIEKNIHLKNKIIIHHQIERSHILKGALPPHDEFDFSMCNPPFHASAEEAALGTKRKLKNLGIKKEVLNFGGKSHELWCKGGEEAFVKKMILESELVKNSCLWFTTLVSKKDNLIKFQKELNKVSAIDVRIIEMKQGQKVSRILAWSYKNKEEQMKWAKRRWSLK